MEMKIVLRRIATIVDEAWMNCASQENRELLAAVGTALRKAAGDRLPQSSAAGTPEVEEDEGSNAR